MASALLADMPCGLSTAEYTCNMSPGLQVKSAEPGPHVIDPAVLLCVAALLGHGTPAVQRAAAAAVSAAVRMQPLLGLSFLPLLMHQVQASVVGSREGKCALCMSCSAFVGCFALCAFQFCLFFSPLSPLI